MFLYLGCVDAFVGEFMATLLSYVPFCFTPLLIEFSLNTLRPRPNGHRFTDDIFQCIFVNNFFRILIKISWKFIAGGPIDNRLALFQITAWRRRDKSLSEPMLV